MKKFQRLNENTFVFKEYEEPDPQNVDTQTSANPNDLNQSYEYLEKLLKTAEDHMKIVRAAFNRMKAQQFNSDKNWTQTFYQMEKASKVVRDRLNSIDHWID